VGPNALGAFGPKYTSQLLKGASLFSQLFVAYILGSLAALPWRCHIGGLRLLCIAVARGWRIRTKTHTLTKKN
jgi:hypothetical protein